MNSNLWLLKSDRIAETTNFNGTNLLSGQSDKGVLEIQVGTRNAEGDRIGFNIEENDVRAEALGIEDLNSETIEDSRQALDVIDEGLARVNGARARLGAMSNKLQSTVRNLSITTENLSAARSRVADADVAQVSADLTRDNILQSAGISVLAQANSAPAQALKLV
jgi:flagellin